MKTLLPTSISLVAGIPAQDQEYVPRGHGHHNTMSPPRSTSRSRLTVYIMLTAASSPQAILRGDVTKCALEVCKYDPGGFVMMSSLVE